MWEWYILSFHQLYYDCYLSNTRWRNSIAHGVQKTTSTESKKCLHFVKKKRLEFFLKTKLLKGHPRLNQQDPSSITLEGHLPCSIHCTWHFGSNISLCHSEIVHEITSLDFFKFNYKFMPLAMIYSFIFNVLYQHILIEDHKIGMMVYAKLLMIVGVHDEDQNKLHCASQPTRQLWQRLYRTRRYLQLSIINGQCWVSIGYIRKSMSHWAVNVILWSEVTNAVYVLPVIISPRELFLY